ncbi:T9SS type A sorting domain-containing protein, partial [Candidatus Poribacteria bacterium]|nr:T9SS type A sorting domain-containing protein [Candidatus Poribacteria bacterium]
ADVTGRGEKWNFTIRTSDGSEFSDLFTSSTAIIGNGKPSIDNIKISPVNPLTTDDLVLTYTYSDTEKDPESGTEIKWSKNNVPQPNYDNQKNIPGSATQRDDKWNCVIRPKDGIDFGKSFQSPTVTIGNTPPTALDILPLSGQVLRGASVIITAQGTDPDFVDTGAALKSIIAYRFPGDNWTELLTEYVEVPTPRWQAVFNPDVRFKLGSYDFRARFIDTAKSESDWKVKEKLVIVANNPPVIDPIADNLRIKEDTVTQFDLRVYGNDLEDGKNLLWDIDQASVNRTLMQATITANRFLEIKPMDDKNGSDDITLTLTDTDGAVTIKSDVTIIIEPVNDPPTMPTSVRITPALPKTIDNLVCEASGSIDPDGDVVVYRYQWYRNSEIQTGLRSSNVPYARTLKGEIWKCEVIPSDGVSDGPMRFAETNITNSSPEVSIKDVTGNTKEIKLIFDLKDADDDSCKLEVEYQVKGEGWKTATVKESIASVKPGLGLTLTWQSDKDKGGIATDTCKLRLKADDGSIATIPLESKTFPLDNKSPQFTIKAIPNPIHPHFVDITIVSDEKLLEIPELSAILSSEETVALSVKSSGDLVWVSKLTLEDGFFGVVRFQVKGTDISGNKGEGEISEMLKVPISLPRPSETQLFQNYPNPADKEDTRIPYQLKESSTVIVEIYSTTGELVRTLNLGYKVAGFYKDSDKAAIWDIKDDHGNTVASGVYFCYFKAGNFKAVKKIVVRR